MEVQEGQSNRDETELVQVIGASIAFVDRDVVKIDHALNDLGQGQEKAHA